MLEGFAKFGGFEGRNKAGAEEDPTVCTRVGDLDFGRFVGLREGLRDTLGTIDGAF